MKLPALFIGRFQPPHVGHMDALAQIFTQEKDVVIAIGSAEDDYRADNPFTAGERYQMIEAMLKNIKKTCAIIPVRNINHYSLWVSHIERLLPPFGAVYTGSPIVARLFKNHGVHEVRRLKLRKKIAGTLVRRLMQEGDDWERFVPPEVAKLISHFDGVQRIKEIYGY